MTRFPRILLLLTAAALAACAAKKETTTAPQAAPAPEAALEAEIPFDPQIVSGKLENGFRYLIRANQKPEKRAEFRLTVDVGSVLEEEDEQGLAHFVEHMAFNGTANFAKQELVDYLETIGMRFGPDLNAYTGFDETVYMLTVPTDSSEFVDKAFQILEDWAHQVSNDSVEIDKERGVVIEEWRGRRGAGQRMLDEQLPIILKDSRYAERLPIGEKAVLDTFEHATLRDFYTRWYRPELMGFVAVGDFDPAAMEAKAREHFSRIQRRDDAPERALYPVPDHEETLFAIATDPEATGNSISIYYKQDVREQQTVGAYRRSLIEGLYHGMFNRRLQELTQLPEPPFLYGYSGQGRLLRTKEFFQLGAGVQDNGFDAGLEALLTEAARVREFGFTSSELERLKKASLRGMEQAYRERDKSRSSGFASEYVRHLLEGEPVPGIEKELELYRELLPGIGLAEVNALASGWTGESNRVIALNAPEKEGLHVPSEEELLAVFARVSEKGIEPYEDDVSEDPIAPELPLLAQIAATDSIPELGVTKWTLSNGIRVFLKPTDFKNDQVLFRAYSPGGHSLVEDPDYVAASTAASVVTGGGVAQFDLIELRKKLAGKVVSVSPWIGGLQEGISGSASPQDLPTMFELVYAYFTSPRQDSTAFTALRKRMKGSIENRSARPETAFYDTLGVTMAQYHHRARPTSLAILEEMDLGKSMQVYRDRFADAGDFTFCFVGNFTPGELEPLVLTYLGGLPATGREETWRDVGIRPPSGVIEKTVRRGMEPKSRSEIVFTGPFEFDGWRNNFVLGAMADVLEIKLREVMREDLGGTYHVSVGGSASHYPDERYRVNLRFGCDPERVEELTGVVFEQIDSLKTAGTTEEYLTKIKETAKREREVQLKENGFWVRGILYVDFHGIDPLRSLQYDEMVDSLTLEDVRSAAEKYFDMENYVRVVLLPEEGSAEPSGG